MGGEQFAWTRVTGEPQRTVREVAGVQLNGTRVGVGFTGDLAENPVAVASLSQHDRWTQFGSSEIGERKVNYDDLSGCKYAHAASSSGRSQSSLSAASLKSAASCG